MKFKKKEFIYEKDSGKEKSKEGALQGEGGHYKCKNREKNENEIQGGDYEQLSELKTTD